MDLGHGHTLRWLAWAPDRKLNPQFAHLPDVDKFGAIVGHPVGPHPIVPISSGYCEGAITLDGPVQREVRPAGALWQVESWEPLTLSPSLLCACGDHGFIRAGRWVPA